MSNSEEYFIRSTSCNSSEVNPIQLLETENINQTSRTRILLKPEIVCKNGHNTVRINILKQKKHTRQQINTIEWPSIDSFDRLQLDYGQETKIELDSESTSNLFNHLCNLYNISREEVFSGFNHFTIVKNDNALILFGDNREKIQSLLNNDPDFIDKLEEISPGLLENTAHLKEYERRIQALEEFEINLNDTTKDENHWQSFLDNNHWIFGYSLNIFINRGQTNFGGMDYTGQGQQRGDFLGLSQGEIKFTVPVEIKKPSSQLVKNNTYRTHVYELGNDLVGGVCQLQAYCMRWQRESASQENMDRLETQNIYTCQPRGILVIGNTSQLNNRDKKHTFELYRRNLFNPEIITFDELYERAKFIVNSSCLTITEDQEEPINDYEEDNDYIDEDEISF